MFNFANLIKRRIIGYMGAGKGHVKRAQSVSFDVPSHRHTNPDGKQGGLVEDTATVAATAFLGPNTQVRGHAQVLDNAALYDYVQVSDTVVITDNAYLSNRVQVSGDVKVSGSAVLSDNVRVSGNVEISGFTKVGGHAELGGNVKVLGSAIVCGDAKLVGDEVVSGDEIVDGRDKDRYKNKKAVPSESVEQISQMLSARLKTMFAVPTGLISNDVRPNLWEDDSSNGRTLIRIDTRPEWREKDNSESGYYEYYAEDYKVLQAIEKLSALALEMVDCEKYQSQEEKDSEEKEHELYYLLLDGDDVERVIAAVESLPLVPAA